VIKRPSAFRPAPLQLSDLEKTAAQIRERSAVLDSFRRPM
jgi:hypothetical protein